MVSLNPIQTAEEVPIPHFTPQLAVDDGLQADLLLSMAFLVW